MSTKRLILIDGFSLLYRAFYGNKFMSTTDGRPTNALFGFLGMVLKVMEDKKPDAVLVALDAPGKTFRHAEFAEYKGTRREMPDEMKSQIPIAREMISALGIPQLELVGYEADDIIGTISRQAEEHGYLTTIITGDHDALQLVDNAVSVVTPRVGVTDVVEYDVAGVVAKYGFGPEFLTDYKAMAGDTSDNIPGVPGIGDKSATALILKFGHVEEMLARFDEVEEKFRKKIEPAKENVPKSKWLATIDRHAPIEWDYKPFKINHEELNRALKFLEALEFRQYIKRLPGIFGHYFEGGGISAPIAVEVVSAAIEPQKHTARQNFVDLEKWIDGRRYAIYDEPADQTSMFDESTGRIFVACDQHVVSTTEEACLAMLLTHPERAICHDSKAWFTRARKAGMPIKNPAGFDAVLAGYVLQSGRSQYAFRDLVQGYLDVQPPSNAEQGAVAVGMLEAPMRERLGKESQTQVLDEIELPLVPVLVEMEGYGIEVSRDFLLDFSKSLEGSIQTLQQRIFELAGCEFVIGSPKQLGEVLFEKLGIPGAKKTKTGYATGAEVLQLLAPEHEIASEVMNWRELTKLKSTYSDALPRMINDDNRIHTSFNQTVAATGRLSSNEPNLQNIPIRTELGRQIRKAFVAGEGYTLASFDYSQIELRLLAHMCQDEVLVDAFQKRVDVHTVTAALTFHIPQEEVTKEQRRLAKMLNYAVLYGVTDFGLANQLGGGFSISEAKQLITQYYERFPTVKRFTESIVEEARAKGFTATMAGRRRYFPDIHAANRNERMYAERQAINAPIQGTAADMIKIAMLHVHKRLGGANTRMLLQVHDELVFELAKGTEPESIEPIRQTMEQAMPLSVPVEVDAKTGANWNEMTVR
ncbi:MAG: DNA polymerase I [Chthonomonas sp.]|nr:DNA polymerase I [Chthonomonas sp.]